MPYYSEIIVKYPVNYRADPRPDDAAVDILLVHVSFAGDVEIVPLFAIKFGGNSLLRKVQKNNKKMAKTQGFSTI